MADTSLGKAYVQIVPSAEGISGSITEVLSPEAEKAGKKTSKTLSGTISAGMTKTGKGLTAGVTVPLAAIGAASVAAWKEVDTGLDTIVQKTGASGEALDGMSDVMNNLATTIPTDFATAGAAIGEVNTRFGSTGEELESLSGQFIKFAQLNGTDVSQSVDSVSSMMAAFGLETQDAGRMLDALNTVGQQTGVDVTYLSDAVAKNAASFQGMGMTAEQAASYLGTMSMAGLDSSTAMRGIQTAMKNAAKDGKSLDEVLGEFETTMNSNASESEKLTAAYELFGTRAGGAIANAVSNGTISLTDFTSGLGDFEGSVSGTFEGTLDPIDKFQTSLNKIKSVGADVGASLLETLAPVVEQVADVIQKVLDAWNGLSPETQQMIIKAALIAAAIGPVLLGVGQLISTITTVISTVKTLGSVFQTVAMGPVGLIIAAIAAAVVVGILLYKNWDKVKAKVLKIWNTIKENASVVWESIKAVVLLPIRAARKVITTVWNKVTSFLSEKWEAIKTTASTVWEAIKTVVTAPIQAAKRVVSKAVDKISSVFDVFNSVKETVTSVFESIGNAISNPIETAKGLVDSAVSTIKNLFPISMGKIFSGIKLPHFKISGGKIPWGIGGMGTKPSIDVEWYKKAYDTPYLFNSSTIVPTLTGLKGFGDGNGGEIVYGRNQLLRDIAAASNGGIYNFAIYGAVGQDPREIAEEVRKIIVRQEKQRRLAWT